MKYFRPIGLWDMRGQKSAWLRRLYRDERQIHDRTGGFHCLLPHSRLGRHAKSTCCYTAASFGISGSTSCCCFRSPISSSSNTSPFTASSWRFKNYSVRKGIAASPWNEFEHFKYMMSEPGFVPAFRNTLIISFLRILIGFPVPIILALAINEVRLKRYNRIVQTTLTFPHFLSWVLLGGIFLNMFGTNGVIRKMVDVFNPEAAKNWNFLYDPKSFRMLLVLSDIWKEAGWGTIIYLAAIAGVDPAIEEAAMIDGCNRWRRIVHVTAPGISAMVVIQFVLRVGAVMEGGFDQVFKPVHAAGVRHRRYLGHLHLPPVLRVHQQYQRRLPGGGRAVQKHHQLDAFAHGQRLCADAWARERVVARWQT